MKDDIIYLELNHWSYDYYPDCEPFETWFENECINSPLKDREWLKKNKICVKMFIVDMSFNFLITAPREFIERECPMILTNERYLKFLRYTKEGDETPESRMIPGEYFLPYTEENIGTYQKGEWYQ